MSHRPSATRTSRSLNNLLIALAGLTLLAISACSGPSQTAHTDHATVTVRTDPGTAGLGDNHFTFQVDHDGTPMTDGAVHFRMFMKGMPMSTDQTPLITHHDGKGKYRGIGDFAMGGTWQVEVTIQPQGGTPETVTFPFEIEWTLG